MSGIKICCLLLLGLVVSCAGQINDHIDLLTVCKELQLRDDNYRNPQRCSSYIACSGGVTYIMPCPEGLVYNFREDICDYRDNVPECRLL